MHSETPAVATLLFRLKVFSVVVTHAARQIIFDQLRVVDMRVVVTTIVIWA